MEMVQKDSIQHPKSSWRLIPLLRASGQLQMAIDQWLLEHRPFHWDIISIGGPCLGSSLLGEKRRYS